MSEKDTKKVEKRVKKFMKSVNSYLAEKSGGSVEKAWGCSLMLLEEYYRQFLALTDEINTLNSLVVNSRYGLVPHPLLAARDKAAIRLESLMKSCGITFKEAAKMEVFDPVVEESPLDIFVKNKIEKR